MNIINKRIISVFSIIFVFILFLGLLMFSMFSKAEEYALKSVNYHLYDKEVENMGSYRFDCTKCDESVLCPKEAPFLEIK